jgi:hypothetical protein
MATASVPSSLARKRPSEGLSVRPEGFGNPAVRNQPAVLRTAREFAGLIVANSGELAFSRRRSERPTATHVLLSLRRQEGFGNPGHPSDGLGVRRLGRCELRESASSGRRSEKMASIAIPSHFYPLRDYS